MSSREQTSIKEVIVSERRHDWSVLSQWLCLYACCAMLFVFADMPLWQGHLRVDTGAFYDRAQHFLSDGNWKGLQNNEYLPGSLWIFAFIDATAKGLAGSDADAFLRTWQCLMLGLIVLHFLLFRFFGNRRSVWTFLLLLPVFGPILLYRFELAVSILTIGAWLFLKRGRMLLSGLLLGLAVSTKIYPVILLPFIVLQGFTERSLRKVACSLIGFTTGVIAPVAAFLSFGGSLSGIVESIRFHALKPIGLESLWSPVAVFWKWSIGISVPLVTDHGINGVRPPTDFISLSTLDVLSAALTIAVVMLLVWRKRKIGYADAIVPFLTLFAFQVSSRLMNPQYLWWFFSFLPLLLLQDFPVWKTYAVLGVSALSVGLTQIIYPLYYSQFLDWFSSTPDFGILFSVLCLRNALLLGLVLLLLPSSTWMRLKKMLPIHVKSNTSFMTILVVSLASMGWAFSLVQSQSFFGDEGFHLSQINLLTNGKFQIDPGITMFPGYHALQAAFANGLGLRDSLLLGRQINIVLSILSVVVLHASVSRKESGRMTSIPRTLQYLFLPILFPFFILLYTDVASLFFVMLASYFACSRRYAMAALLGILSLTIRQNNIVWFGFFCTLWLLDSIDWKSVLMLRREPSFKRLFAKNETTLITGSLFLLGILGFISFVLINDGIAIGDKSSHPFPSFHTGNVFFWLFLQGVLLLPLHLHRIHEAFFGHLFSQKNLLIRSLIVVGVYVLFTLTFNNTHAYNQASDLTFIRNSILTLAVKNEIWKTLFFLPVGLATLGILVTPLREKRYVLLYPFAVLFLSGSWLVDPRYSFIPIVLFLMLRKSDDEGAEWRLAWYEIIFGVTLFIPIALRTFFL